MDLFPRLGKRELICQLLFTYNYAVSVWRGFLFLWVLGMVYVILLWHSLSLPYNYFSCFTAVKIAYVQIISSSISVAAPSGHHLGKSCSLTRLTVCSLCNPSTCICNFNYFPFWFQRRDLGSDCTSPRSLLTFYFYFQVCLELHEQYLSFLTDIKTSSIVKVLYAVHRWEPIL